MKKLSIFAFVFCSGLLFAQQKEKAAEYIKEGIYYHDEGQYDRALAMYDKALELDRENSGAFYEKAFTLYVLRRYDESIDYSKKAIKAGKNDKEALKYAYLVYGNTLDETGKPKEALSAYNKGLKINPDDFLLHFNKGITLSRLQRHDEALASLWKAVTLNPNHPGSHSAISEIEMIRGNKIPAAMALARFLTLESQGARAEENSRRLKMIVDGWVVVKKDGNMNITVNVSPQTFGKKKKNNDFSTLDVILPIAIAGEALKEKYENDIDQFNGRFSMMCSMLNVELDDKSGFYWKYYAPYFAEMSKNELTSTFSRIAFLSTGEDSVVEWVNANKERVYDFFRWSQDFHWSDK